MSPGSREADRFTRAAVEGTDLSPEPDAARQRSREDVASLLAAGVAWVQVVSSKDLTACPACRAVNSRLYAIALVPLPPIHGCAVGCGCQVAAVSLE